MIRIIHVEIATDGQEPFTWVNTPSPSNPDLYAFHKQVEQRQRYLLRVSNHLSALGTIKQEEIKDALAYFFSKEHHGIPNTITTHGRWTTYKQGSLTIMTEEQ